MVIGGWVISYIVNVTKGALFSTGLDLSNPISKEVTETFYHQEIDNNQSAIAFYTFIFVLVNFIILRKGIIQGIEKAVKYLMPLLFICLRVMITLSSHLNKEENLIKTATITGILNTLIAVMAGFMIFPSIFSAGLQPDSGPSLVFKTLPIAFSRMGGGDFFAIIFFSLLIIAALTTSLTIYQVIISVLYEKFRIKLNSAIFITLATVYVLGNIPCVLSTGLWSDVTIFGTHIFDAFDFFSGNICFVLTALGATLYVGYVLKDEAKAELNNYNDKESILVNVWYNYVRYVAPIIIIAIFVYGII